MSRKGVSGIRARKWLAGTNRSARSLWITSALFAMGSILFALSIHKQFGHVSLVTYAWLHVALLTVISVWVFIRRELQQSQIIGLVLAITVPFYYLIWANHMLLAGSGLLWAPFLALKVVIVTLAVTNPGPYWLTLLLLGGFASESILLWFQLGLGALPSGVVAGEPWYTTMFFVISTGLVLFRRQQDVLERQLLAADLRSRLLSRVAHLFLQVRDQANTPLQQLNLALELLDRGASTPQEESEGMRRALKKLTELNHSFSQYNELVQWDGGELDAGKSLADQMTDVGLEFVHGRKSK